MTEIPWTVRAWNSQVMGGQGNVAEWTRRDLAEDGDKVPPLATFKSGDRWSTLADIQNPSLHEPMRRYAAEHGHVIPDEVESIWQGRIDASIILSRLSRAMAKAVDDELEAGERDPRALYAAALAGVRTAEEVIAGQ
jgi:hypothetical protein